MPLRLAIRLDDIVIIIGALSAFVLQELAFHAWG